MRDGQTDRWKGDSLVQTNVHLLYSLLVCLPFTLCFGKPSSKELCCSHLVVNFGQQHWMLNGNNIHQREIRFHLDLCLASWYLYVALLLDWFIYICICINTHTLAPQAGCLRRTYSPVWYLLSPVFHHLLGEACNERLDEAEAEAAVKVEIPFQTASTWTSGLGGAVLIGWCFQFQNERKRAKARWVDLLATTCRSQTRLPRC